MKRTILSMTLSLGFALSAAACGGGGDSCATFKKKICEGHDDAFCKKVDGWIANEMVGPNGKAMSGKELDMACKMLTDDKKVLDLYKKKAAEDLK